MVFKNADGVFRAALVDNRRSIVMLCVDTICGQKMRPRHTGEGQRFLGGWLHRHSARRQAIDKADHRAMGQIFISLETEKTHVLW
jgi:hypothetical protein